MAPASNDDALQRFETIWEHVECGISIIDAATREILDINPVAARMFGDDKEKIIGKRCHKFICPAEADSCPIMDKGQVVDRSERKFVRANGETIPIVKSVAKIQYNGRLALLESFTDISNLKEAEEKLLQLEVTKQASQAKSEFISRMSHEMRTPMNAIIGMAKVAEKTDDPDKLKYCLAAIGNSSQHLLGLINDVLDMSKIEAGKFELDLAEFDIENMLMKLCGMISGKIEEKGINLSVSVDGRMRKRYLGDELRLAQVLTNLLSNAAKFTRNGGRVGLKVDVAEADRGSSLLRFVVSDNGIGMTPEQAGRLFKAFEQADTSISRRFGGTGLGLVISRNIVEKMNGRISVESAPDQGTTFTVEVELSHADSQPDERAAGLAGVQAATDVNLSGRRILAVLAALDDAAGSGLFRGMSGDFGFALDLAASGRQATELAEAAERSGQPYDYVFLDYDLPDMTGIEAARLLGAERCGPMFLVASFLRWNVVDEEARAAGISTFVAKPLFRAAILDVLRKIDGAQGALAGTACAARATDSVAQRPDFSGIRLLLAEDVEINREIFASLLEDTGIGIDMAEDGREALEMFKSDPEKYDLIVMDVQMPGLDGYEATRLIRALEHELAASIPIIAMTANVFKDDIDRCLACGMNSHLAKPIDESRVIEAIREHCPGR